MPRQSRTSVQHSASNTQLKSVTVGGCSIAGWNACVSAMMGLRTDSGRVGQTWTSQRRSGSMSAKGRRIVSAPCSAFAAEAVSRFSQVVVGSVVTSVFSGAQVLSCTLIDVSFLIETTCDDCG
jgi:hypothetical protein